MLQLDSKTQTGTRIWVTSNGNQKTFTLRVWAAPIRKGDRPTVYKTVQMNKQDFLSCCGNTVNDWQEFLKRESGSYYLVKL